MEEVCGKSIPQKEAGGKGLSASKVRSPTVLSVSGLTSLNSPPGGAGGLTPPYPTQGSLERGLRPEYSTTGARMQEGFEVRSPTVFSVSGLTFLDSPPGGAGGADAPSPHAGGF